MAINKRPGTIMSDVVTLSLNPYLMMRKLKIQSKMACMHTWTKRLESGGRLSMRPGLRTANKSAGDNTFGAVISNIYITRQKSQTSCTTVLARRAVL